MGDILKGKLNSEKIFIKYKGKKSSTADVIVDNEKFEISVNTKASSELIVSPSESGNFLPVVLAQRNALGQHSAVKTEQISVRPELDNVAIKLSGPNGEVLITSSSISKNEKEVATEEQLQQQNVQLLETINSTREQLNGKIDNEINRATHREDELLESINQETERAQLAEDAISDALTTERERIDQANEHIESLSINKYDKRGGLIDGDVTISGDLHVQGTTVTRDSETMTVKARYVETNGNGADIRSVTTNFENTSGIIIKIDKGNAYGIVYSNVKPSANAVNGIDAVILGSGKVLFNAATETTVNALKIVSDDKSDITENEIKISQVTMEEGQPSPQLNAYVIPSGNFKLNANESNPVATRALSSQLLDKQHLRWDSSTNKLVGSNLADVGDVVVARTSTLPTHSAHTLTTKDFVDTAVMTEHRRAVEREDALSRSISELVSHVDESVSNLESAIEEEANVREIADNNIIDKLDAITANLDTTDTLLNFAINRERDNRIDADRKLDTKINATMEALNGEIASRDSADSTLRDTIDYEARRAAEAESNLSDAIAQEVTNREAAINALDTPSELENKKYIKNVYQEDGKIFITKESFDETISSSRTTTAPITSVIKKYVDDEIADKVTTESNARQSADNQLSTQITQVTNKANTNAQDISDEITTRSSADTQLDAKIDALSEDVDSRLEALANREHTHDVATSTANGFMSSTDKVALDTIKDLIGSASGDSDATVNKIREVLAVFEDYPEGDKLTVALANKSDITHDHNNQYTPLLHNSRTDNPHSVTKAQVGLSNVDNTSDANKPISTATQNALNNKVDKVTGKQLSTNDFTNFYLEKINQTATLLADVERRLSTVTITW